VDDNFVGDTPSTVNVAPGSHAITVRKKGFTDWTRTLNVTGGSVHLSADLNAAAAQ
jgi:PEGA domain